MAYQAVFKRYELKYILSTAQQQRLLEAMDPHMALDKYGRTTIRNLYFDTDHYRLIRRSIEKPVFKEKLRLRSYRQAAPEDPVFVEIKRKFRSQVYKRRLAMPEQRAMDWLVDKEQPPPESQIGSEIAYFMQYYQTLHPVVYLSYDRLAYYCRQGGDFRITFDDNILARREDLSLQQPPGGTRLLPQGQVLMEIKTSGGIPLWLTDWLTRERIYKTSFSKYGTAYKTMIYKGVGDYV